MQPPSDNAGFRPAPILRFRAAIVACAALAVLYPLLVLHAGSPADLAAVLIGGALIVLLVFLLVRPLGSVARLLDACLTDGLEDRDGARPAVGDPRAAGGLVGMAAELTARIDAMRQRLTNRHAVTGLPTREPFLAELVEDLAASDATAVLSVVRFVDHDRLAAFDQTAADRALRAFAHRLRGAVPPARPVAQVDRDCFAVWLRNTPSEKAAAQELRAMGYVLGQELGAGEMTLAPTVAIGAAVFPRDGANPGELLTRALSALEIGRPAAVKLAFFSRQDSAAAREQFALEQDLRGALSRDEFLLHYQPVVDLAAGRVVGAEALLRWRHPTLGTVPPSRFIPILERSSMVAEVGLWVLNAACREMSEWRAQGLDALKVAVNLSPIQCRDPRLNEMVQRTLERHGVPASSLELELTETAAMEDADHIRRLLGELRAGGVSVAIDDFGAGYSSMTYLKNLPFSKLKIDREFVTDVDKRRDSRAICAALIALAKGLGIELLAEGVETRAEVETLRAMGCRLFQGFFFSKPVPSPQFLAAVRAPAALVEQGSDVRARIETLRVSA